MVASNNRRNRNGAVLHGQIRATLLGHGMDFREEYYLPVARQDGSRIRADFYVLPIPTFPDGLVIESKWQGSRGSVSNKFIGLVMDIREYYPCPALIVEAGGGAPDSARRWLREQVDGEKLIGVLNQEEFTQWANRSL